MLVKLVAKPGDGLAHIGQSWPNLRDQIDSGGPGNPKSDSSRTMWHLLDHCITPRPTRPANPNPREPQPTLERAPHMRMRAHLLRCTQGGAQLPPSLPLGRRKGLQGLGRIQGLGHEPFGWAAASTNTNGSSLNFCWLRRNSSSRARIPSLGVEDSPRYRAFNVNPST